MPARSTPFQKLVHHIQQQLVGGASVVESAMLRHRGIGDEREVDIVVRATAGEHPVVISLECIEQGRPADQTCVEQMKAKHDFLETDRLVLVSLNGFYEPALRLAEFYGIATYTPDQAITVDWTKLVGEAELAVHRYDFRAEAIWLLFNTPEGRFKIAAGHTTRVRRPDLDIESSLDDFVRGILRHKNFADLILPKLEEDGNAKIEFGFTIDKPLLALAEQDIWCAVAGFHVIVAGQRSSSPLAMKSLNWKGTPAAFGHAPTVLGDTLVTIVEQAPGQIDARMTVDGKDIAVRFPSSKLTEEPKPGG